MGDTHPEGKRPYGNQERYWNNAALSQETPSIASNHQKPGKKHETDYLSQPSEKHCPTDTLVYNFFSPDL